MPGEGERRKLEAELEQARHRIDALSAALDAQAGPHRQADGAPLTGHQLFEGLFESGRVPVAILDPDFRFVRVNHAFARQAGEEPGAFVGRGHFDAFPDSAREAAFRRVVETGEPQVALAAPIRFGPGPEPPVTYWDWTLTPHKGPDGAVVRLTLLLVDVTESARAAEAVADSEARYRSLAEAVPVGVFRADAAGRALYVNDRLCRMTGLPAEAFLGEGWKGSLHPDDRAWVGQRWARAAASGQPFAAEFRLLGPRGETVWVYSQAVPELGSDGTATGYVGSLTDVTGQRGARETLNVLAASSGDDLDTFLRDCVRHLADAYGARYALVGLVTEPGRDQVETRAVWAGGGSVENFHYDLEGAPCHNLLKGGQVLISEGVGATYADNRMLADLKVESYFGYPLIDAAGKVFGVAVVMDVRPLTLSPWTEPVLGSFAHRIAAEVERHGTEERLALSERNLARAQHVAQLGHWVWDVATGALSASDTLHRILGRDPGARIRTQSDLEEAVHPDDRDRVRAELAAALDPDRRKPYAVEHRIVLPTGQERTVHEEGEVTFDAAGRPRRMIGTVHDITLQHRAHTALAGLAARTGDDLEPFLRDSVHRMAEAFGTRHGFVGMLEEGPPARIRTLAWWKGDGFADNITYDLAGTPCADILSGRLTRVPDGVAARYPDDPFLTAFGIESYFGAPLLGPDGDPVGLVAVLDVRPLEIPSWTEPILGSFARRIAAELERSQARAVRERSEREMSAILANLQDLYCRTDVEGKVVRLSPSVEQVLGYRPEELVGRRLADFYVDPDGPERFLEAVRAAGGRARNHEARIRAKDGRVVWVSVNGQYVRDAEGRVVGVDGTARDITETRRMADALRDSEARLAEAQAIAHLGSWEWSGDTLACSDETFRIYGLAPDSLPGDGTLPAERFLAAVHPDDRERVERSFRRALEDGLAVREEHRVVRPDGAVRTVRQIAVVHGPGTGGGRLVGAVQDITELAYAEADRERVRAQLLQVQKMEAVGLLAGGVAHDFNNLLTIITGFTDLALGRLHEPGAPADPDGTLREDLAEIRLAAERAAGVTRQLLLFSRRQPLAFAPVDLGARVPPLLKMLARVLGEDVEVRTDIASDLWGVRADGTSLDQMLMNLAINARDAMPEGGVLRIAVANVVVPAAQAGAHPEAVPGRFVRVTVSDTGLGMDEVTLARVFEPFFTTKEPGRGTGLGMSVAHGIARLHGGWIQAESVPGRGTAFHVYLPASREAQVAAPRPAIPAAARGEGRRVLVVEDEEALRTFACAALTGCGYGVTDVATAGEAVAAFERDGDAFDLVFSDVVLPDGSGLKLAEDLLSRRPDLKVLLSSGYPDPQAGWDDIAERGLAFIQKPYSLETLLRAVGDGVRGGSQAPDPAA